MSHSDQYSLEGSASQCHLRSPPSHAVHPHGSDTPSQSPGLMRLPYLPTPGDLEGFCTVTALLCPSWLSQPFPVHPTASHLYSRLLPLSAPSLTAEILITYIHAYIIEFRINCSILLNVIDFCSFLL